MTENMKCVLQDWVLECSFKEQTVLMTALRGCDVVKKDIGKPLVRIMRFVILKNADSSTGFGTFDLITPTQIDEFSSQIGLYPVHWLQHFMHGCEIIGYRHTDADTAYSFQQLYIGICKALHTNPEMCSQMTDRLKDKT
jgi:hypothetical protein